ncbi:uncharacterized protein LOC118648278 [Monomorium pharaonis]|uniref:uncharacterized protein LOC118648278 n=1 Tax=Monomorium pharaonis TaxID=307658 RepID=UPI0017473366|nr:uncharacterized protein LOC118648278 [Monomorium pharaonis]
MKTFIIKCKEDNSYCMVEAHNVICDENMIKNGETVDFFWNKKKFTGKVIMSSENVAILNEELDKLKNENKSKKRLLPKNELLSKRKIIKKQIFSVSPKATSSKKINRSKTVKKIHQNLDKIEISSESDEEANSTLPPDLTIEQLQAIAKKYYKLKNNNDLETSDNVDYAEKDNKSNIKTDEKGENVIKETCKNINVKERNEMENKEKRQADVVAEINKNEDIEKGEIVDANAKQLLQFWTSDDMVHLQDGIYCKQKILDYAIGSSHRASHVARKLLEDVFHESALLQCTFTGQAPRAAEKNEQEKVLCLHDKAKQTFAKDIAKQRG